MTIENIPGWREMTAQQLVTFSQENPQTAKPIKRTDLQEFLRLNRLISISRNGQPHGVVVDLLDNNVLSEVLSAQAEGLISKVFFESHEVIETNSDDYRDLLVSLMSLVHLPQQEVAKFYQLAGGRKYPLFATEAEATAAQAAAILRESQAAARSQIDAAVSLADAARFASEQAGSDGPACVAAWLAKANEVLG